MTREQLQTDLSARLNPLYGSEISFPDEWIDLLSSLNDDLARIDPNYQILQIKEKDGSLRFYYACMGETSFEDSKLMFELATEAELASASLFIGGSND